MVDTVRTDDEILAILADNTTRLISEQDIRDMFVTIRAGTTYINENWPVDEISDALHSGGHIHFTRGDYDLSGIDGSSIPLNVNLYITGDGWQHTTINVGGTADSLTFKFLLKKNFVLRGIGFLNSRAPWGLTGFDARIEYIDISDCYFENCGAAIVHDLGTVPSASAELGTLRFNRNTFRDINSGIALRMGQGNASANPSVPVDYFEAISNDLKGVGKYGIVCNYDSSPTNGDWPGHSVGIAANNRIVDLVGSPSSVTGFGINLSAAENAIIDSNYFDNVQLGTRTDLEPIYSKNRRLVVCNNILIRAGENQAGIAIKGDDADAGVIMESAHVYGNTIAATDDGLLLNGIWIQGSNSYVHDNVLVGEFGNAAIRTQSTNAYGNIRIERNEIVHADTAGSSAIRLDAPMSNLLVRGNRIRGTAGSSGTFRGIYVIAGASETIDHLLIEDNLIKKDGSTSTFNAIEIDKNASGTITSPRIINNTIRGVNAAVNVGIKFTTTALDGTTIIKDNKFINVTAPITNSTSTTVSALIPGTYTASDATPTVAGIERLTLTTSTTITALDDGIDGQTVILDTTSTPTIDFSGTTLKGNNGSDFTMASTDALRCTKLGTNWYCSLIDGTP